MAASYSTNISGTEASRYIEHHAETCIFRSRGILAKSIRRSPTKKKKKRLAPSTQKRWQTGSADKLQDKPLCEFIFYIILPMFKSFHVFPGFHSCAFRFRSCVNTFDPSRWPLVRPLPAAIHPRAHHRPAPARLEETTLANKRNIQEETRENHKFLHFFPDVSFL